MQPAERLAFLEADSATIAACARARLNAPVPVCPGWTMTDLLKHVGGGQRWIESALRQGATSERDVRWGSPPGNDGIIEWFEQGVTALLSTARAVDVEASMPMLWNADGASGGPDFLRRRATNEAVVHRWDAQNVVGAASPIPVDLALDGLDELLVRWLPWASSVGRQATGPWSGESVVFQADDGPSWRVTFVEPGRVEVTAGDDASATCLVEGAASSLLIFAMNRSDAEELGLRVAGDTEILGRWRTEVRFGSRTPAVPADPIGGVRVHLSSRTRGATHVET